MQDFAFNMAMALKAESIDSTGKVVIRRDTDGKPIDAPVLAALMKSWQTAQERISFHRRVPSPGVLKPEHGPRSKRRRRDAGAMAAGPVSVVPAPGGDVPALDTPTPPASDAPPGEQVA